MPILGELNGGGEAISTESIKSSTEEDLLIDGLEQLIERIIYPDEQTIDNNKNIESIFSKLNILPGAHEGDQGKDTQDIKKLYEWYLGQIYKFYKGGRINSAKTDSLLINVERYCTQKYFGQDLNETFSRTERESNERLTEFKKRHSYKQSWFKSTDSLFKAFFNTSNVLTVLNDREKYKGLTVAVVMRPENLDELPKIYEGELLDRREGGSVIFYIKADSSEIQLNTNNVEHFCVKDPSKPTYREMTRDLKKRGYFDVRDTGIINVGDILSYITLDEQSTTWKKIDAIALEDKRTNDGFVQFKVQIGETESVWNLNNIKKNGQGAVCFSKKQTPKR